MGQKNRGGSLVIKYETRRFRVSTAHVPLHEVQGGGGQEDLL